MNTKYYKHLDQRLTVGYWLKTLKDTGFVFDTTFKNTWYQWYKYNNFIVGFQSEHVFLDNTYRITHFCFYYEKVYAEIKFTLKEAENIEKTLKAIQNQNFLNCLHIPWIIRIIAKYYKNTWLIIPKISKESI